MPERKSQLRIIGGEWRGRRLPITELPGLRPTPDRVRETLFNWLAPVITGARCLDAFAGTGALGLEALSRGAAAVTWVERDRKLAQTIEQQLNILGGHGRVLCAPFDQAALGDTPFDIVFLDPPFNAGLLVPVARQIEPYLAANNRVYLEYERALGTPELGEGWHILKSKYAGQVGFCLATYANDRNAGKVNKL